MADRLYGNIGGILRNKSQTLLAAGGIADHVHLLVSIDKVVAVSDLIRDIKANSSRWMHQTFPNWTGFAWQRGYSVFSVSQSKVNDVKRYIQNQKEHHLGRTFQEECREFWKRHSIRFDERYCWD
jgi:REP element-mobilizing transposase RayT